MASSAAKGRGHPRGDLESCVAAFEAEFDYIHKSLRRHGISDADADDLAQEVFLIMWRRWGDFDAERPVRPWLAGIAFRVAYNHRDRIAREVPGGLVDTRDLAEGPEERIASDRVRALVLQALSQVPEKQRTAMILHHLDGLGVREVARAMKVPLFTAYSRLRAGRRSFAAAVRRLNTIAGAGPPLPARPETLLAADRDRPPPPSERRRARAVSRVRALLLAPGSPSLRPVPGGGSETAGTGRGGGEAARHPRPSSPSAPSSALSRRETPGPTPGRPGGTHLLPWLATGVFLGASALLVFLVRDRLESVPAAVASASAQKLPALMLGRSRGAARAIGASAPPAFKIVPPGGRPPTPGQLAAGMVGYWQFEEGRGTAAVADASGHAKDCVPQRMAGRGDWLPGPHGSAASFDGRTWLECPPIDPMAAGAEEMSIAVWVRRTGPPEKMRAIVSRQQGRGIRDSFFLGFRKDELLLSSDLWRVKLAMHLPAVRERWMHVAATRDRDRIARLYVDGVEVARKKSRALVAPPPAAGAGENGLLIGAAMNRPRPASPSERFVGSIDELVLYDRALPPEEVAALAAGTQPAPSF
jgi:RNA polymerase sigma-70 factor, ECF subfamily